MPKKMQQRRLDLGLTLTEVGRYCGVSMSAVNNWEKDNNAIPPRRLPKLLEALQVSSPEEIGLTVVEVTRTRIEHLQEART